MINTDGDANAKATALTVTNNEAISKLLLHIFCLFCHIPHSLLSTQLLNQSFKDQIHKIRSRI